MSHMEGEGRLSRDDLSELLERSETVLRAESNVLELQAPLNIVGDIHGQYYDLINYFKTCQGPWEGGNSWLFLGDYVDRGSFSCEVVILLLAIKVAFPKKIYLLRGNHECRSLTNHFSFKRECVGKYGEKIYEQFMRVFDCLPLAATVVTDHGTYLCVHAGLSPKIELVTDIECIDRFVEIPRVGPLCDLVWSDPLEEETGEGLCPEEMQEWYDVEFVENPTRGCGYVFGCKAIETFLYTNTLLSIIRAHDVQRGGHYDHFMHRKERQYPMLYTVFSAPNYCNMYGNEASVMLLKDEGVEWVQFSEAPQPYCLPKSFNGITYSIPFIAENVMSILVTIMSVVTNMEDEEQEAQEEKAKERWAIVKKKVFAVAKMQNAMSEVRKDNDSILMLRGLSNSRAKISPQALSQFNIKMKSGASAFDSSKELDMVNEIHPEVEQTDLNTNLESDAIGSLSRSQSTLSRNASFWRKNPSPTTTSTNSLASKGTQTITSTKIESQTKPKINTSKASSELSGKNAGQVSSLISKFSKGS